MAEIRVNATGGLKLFDADDSHYAQIIAGTITSNTDVMTLGHAAVVMGTKLDLNGNNLILDADADTYLDGGTADDVVDVYVAGAKDWKFGANSINVLSGTTLTIDSGATITNSGTANGFSSADPASADGDTLGTASLEWSDLFLADGGIIKFGNDQDTLLTHTDGTGLTLNSTNKLCFNDASQFVQGSSATVLSIGATDEIDLTATAIDINGTCDVSGTFSLGGTNITTTAAEINLIDGGTARGTTALASGDGILINDGGTMRMTNVDTVQDYIGATPAFSAWSGSSQALTADTWTLVAANTEVFDSNGTYNNSTYKFIPGVLGNYLFFGTCYFQSAACERSSIAIYKDSTRMITSTIYDDDTVLLDHPMPTITGVVACTDVGDEFTFYVLSGDSSVNAYGDSTRRNWTTAWGAWKLNV